LNRTSRIDRWRDLERAVVGCERCPRLIDHCRTVARVRRRAYRDQEYWGRPVPGFGDPNARILMLGLAPAAHGANRTGRMFTGDRSGDWLYGSLHRVGSSSQPRSVSRDDGLRLCGVFVSATCRCAPPGNKPTSEEMANCVAYLDREFELLEGLRVVVALGKIAWDAALRRVQRVAPDDLPRPKPRFSHGAECRLPFRVEEPSIWLLGSYHPSQQNTQTGRLTRAMFDRAMKRAATLAQSEPGRPSRVVSVQEEC
jgi:uracil-DNA glycosylase family 4